MRNTSLLLPLLMLVVSCGDRNDRDVAGVADLCSVASLPSATAEERTALITEAEKRWTAMQGSVKNNEKTRAVLSATVELITAGYRAVPPSGAPMPLATLVAQGTESPIKAALAKLKKACM
jgi:hypothetical protein